MTKPASDRVFKIGISGSYGGLNLGDEAILQSIVAQLRAAVPCEITVFSRDAKDTAARHKVERSVPVRDLSRDEVRPKVADLDLLILGGAASSTTTRRRSTSAKSRSPRRITCRCWSTR